MLLVLLGSGVLVWQLLHAQNERAVAIAREACREAALQLLDATVSLQALRLRRQDGELGWTCDYAFDVSADGVNRVHGRLRLHSQRLVWIDIPRGPGGSDLWMAPSGSSQGRIGQDR